MNAESTTTTGARTTAERFEASARAALLAYFSAQGLTYGDGPNGEILVPFDHDGRRLLVAAWVGERPEPGIWLQLIAAEPIAREHWAATLVAVNRWNTMVPCPRAVLRVGDWETDADATLTLDVWLPFGSAGADAVQIEQVTAAVLAATSYFAAPSPSRTVGDRAAESSG